MSDQDKKLDLFNLFKYRIHDKICELELGLEALEQYPLPPSTKTLIQDFKAAMWKLNQEFPDDQTR